MAVPFLVENPSGRYLDFGSGQGDYAAALRRRGLRLHDVELFRRGATNALDLRSTNSMIDRLCADLAGHGRYDATVCDSVLNSVDSLDAEAAVMTTLNALTKPGGRVFFSGRPAERNDAAARYTKRADSKSRRAVEFLDANGFTAIFRAGHWFYQKFHSRAEIAPLCGRFGLRLDQHVHGGSSWQAAATKVADLPRDTVRTAFEFEFNIGLGQGKRLGRDGDVCRAYDAAMRAGDAAESDRP
jgi:ParB family chromosome partitioning protein